MQPITIFCHLPMPNPAKIHILLEELGLPYESVEVDMSEVKAPSYTKHNPNGLLPTIIDPNTGITVWESGAIMFYLISTYDKERKLSFTPDTPDAFAAMQWLMFQMSGQGPYFGQANWFTHYASTPVPSARERYVNEIKRVTSVLDKGLEGKKYLVGERCSYADLSFVPWYWALVSVDFDGKLGLLEELHQKYPSWKAWFESLESRPVATKIKEEMVAVFNK